MPSLGRPLPARPPPLPCCRCSQRFLANRRALLPFPVWSSFSRHIVAQRCDHVVDADGDSRRPPTRIRPLAVASGLVVVDNQSGGAELYEHGLAENGHENLEIVGE
jgi:hypothetical protein